MGNDLWVAVALESVPLRSTYWACQKTEPDAHHILFLQHALRFRSSILFVNKYILRCFLAQYFVLSLPRTRTPPYMNSLCSCGLHEKQAWKSSTISKRKTSFRGRQPFGRNASFIKNSRANNLIAPTLPPRRAVSLISQTT